MKGLPFLYATRSGTRPGDGIADVLFAAIFVNGLLAVQDRLACEGISQFQGSGAPLMPTWADDASLPMQGSSPEHFLQKASVGCQIVHEELGRRALELSYREDKSALLVSWRGVGSRTLHARCLCSQKPLVFQAFGKEVQVPLVSSYVHLGTKITDQCSAMPDIRRKLQQASARAKPVAAKVLRWEAIELEKRKLILRSIGVSVARYNFEVWGSLSIDEQRAWCSGFDSLYRLLHGEDRHTSSPVCPTVYEVCGRAGMPFPMAVASLCRIRHLVRVVTQNHSALWEALVHEFALSGDSWLHLLLRDLEWVKSWSGLLEWPDFPAFQPEDLAVWIDDHPRAVVCGAVRAMNAQSSALRKWFVFQCEQRRQGSFQGVNWIRTQCQGTARHPCPVCGDLFPSGSHIAIHAANVHGHICPSRRYASGTRCRACLKEQWTVSRLRRHLSSGTSCLAKLLASVPPLSQEGIDEMDSLSSVQLRSSKMAGGSSQAERAPTLRAHGPLRPMPEDLEAQLLAAWADASPFEKIALSKSFLSLAGESFEALSLLVEVSPPPVFDRAAPVAFECNPDGRNWIALAEAPETALPLAFHVEVPL